VILDTDPHLLFARRSTLDPVSWRRYNTIQGRGKRAVVSQTLRLAVPLLLIAIVAGAFWGARGPQPLPSVLAAPAEETVADDMTITVHVAGLVHSPGLVELADDARVADAVAAAGGLRPGADTSAVNLAAPLRDGEQIIIPGLSEGGPSSGGGSAIDGDGRVRINHATLSELETLPGVGPVLAQRIVDFREEHGPFQTVEDLLDVPGIGEAKLASLRDHLLVP
jgi:competence protein ComEA